MSHDEEWFDAGTVLIRGPDELRKQQQWGQHKERLSETKEEVRTNESSGTVSVPYQ